MNVMVELFLKYGFVPGEDRDYVPACVARLGALWVAVMFASLAVYAGRALVRWNRFVREFRLARITPEELKEKLDAGEKVIIVDLHGHRDGLRVHQGIPGAVCMDQRRLEYDNPKKRTPIPRDCEIVLYCSAAHELTSARVALQLRRRGFERVRPLAGGLQAWHERGFPMTSVILCGIS